MRHILLSQPNFRIGQGSFEGYWLPYSVGCLWAYAQQHDWVKSQFTVRDIVFRRHNIDAYVRDLESVDVAFFSLYMWNRNYTHHLAQAVRAKYPHCVIVYGGPEVPNPVPPGWLEQHPWIDTVVLNEGELPFVDILHTVAEGGTVQSEYQGSRMDDLDVPSPYTTGVFDAIVEANPHVQFNATLETNRGCPFSCTFCDWGSLTYSKIKQFPLHKVMAELDWIAENRMEYITIADANFGVLYKRDMQITDRLIELQQNTGYPTVVNATWYKNSSKQVLEIVKKFAKSGFNRGMTLSMQSMDHTVLEAIKRKNMEISNLKQIFDQCNRQDIKSYTELILGLPHETYDTWCDGLCSVIEAGQHGAIETWLCQILINAELNTPQQKEEHGISTVTVYDYVTANLDSDGIAETGELINATKYMNTDQMVESWTYGWMIINFHCFGWSQVYTRLANQRGVSYRELYDRLFDHLRKDTGVVGNAYRQARATIDQFLRTGKGVPAGHLIQYQAQSDFHLNRADVIAFVDSVFTGEYLDLTDSQLVDLQRYQHAFTTDPQATYPYSLHLTHNWPDVLLGENIVQTNNSEYTVDCLEHNVSVPEYTMRLYARRRQGWGKSIITKTNLKYTHDNAEVYNIATINR
jgi:hypothetical protein